MATAVKTALRTRTATVSVITIVIQIQTATVSVTILRMKTGTVSATIAMTMENRQLPTTAETAGQDIMAAATEGITEDTAKQKPVCNRNRRFRQLQIFEAA